MRPGKDSNHGLPNRNRGFKWLPEIEPNIMAGSMTPSPYPDATRSHPPLASPGSSLPVVFFRNALATAPLPSSTRISVPKIQRRSVLPMNLSSVNPPRKVPSIYDNLKIPDKTVYVNALFCLNKRFLIIQHNSTRYPGLYNYEALV